MWNAQDAREGKFLVDEISGPHRGSSPEALRAFAQHSLKGIARFNIERRGMEWVLNVTGDIDGSNSHVLEAAIAAVARQHEGSVSVSFVDCAFADCSCLTVLMRQFKLLSTRLWIIAPRGSRFRRLLDITSLAQVLPVHSTMPAGQNPVVPGRTGLSTSFTLWNTLRPKRYQPSKMLRILRTSAQFDAAEELQRISAAQVVRIAERALDLNGK
jgi:anti-anti-sigma factor